MRHTNAQLNQIKVQNLSKTSLDKKMRTPEGHLGHNNGNTVVTLFSRHPVHTAIEFARNDRVKWNLCHPNNCFGLLSTYRALNGGIASSSVLRTQLCNAESSIYSVRKLLSAVVHQKALNRSIKCCLRFAAARREHMHAWILLTHLNAVA